MSSVVEQYARQEAEKELKKIAGKLFDTGKFTVAEIADLTGLSLDEVQEICGLQ